MNCPENKCCLRTHVETTPDRVAEDLTAAGRRLLILYGSSLPADLRERLTEKGRDFVLGLIG